MLKRNLQSIQLTLADLEEYENVRRRNRTRQAIEAARGTPETTSTSEAAGGSSETTSTSETVPSTSTGESESTSEANVTQKPKPNMMPGWTTATVTDSTTPSNSGSTEDDTSVQAVVDDNDTIAEFSDDGWVDIDEEEGAVGGEDP